MTPNGISINWTNLFPFKGLLGVFYIFIQILIEYSFKQTVENLIRRRVVRRLFWVCTVCTSHKKDARPIPDKKRNAPLRTVQLSGRSQVIGQFSLYQYKGMSGTAVSNVFCNPASKLC